MQLLALALIQDSSSQQMDPQQAQQMAMRMMAGMIPVLILFWAVKITIYIIPLWQSFKKAGLSGPLALLAAIPLIGRALAMYVLAFSDWKVVPIAQATPLPPYTPLSYPPAPPSYPPSQPPTA